MRWILFRKHAKKNFSLLMNYVKRCQGLATNVLVEDSLTLVETTVRNKSVVEEVKSDSLQIFCFKVVFTSVDLSILRQKKSTCICTGSISITIQQEDQELKLKFTQASEGEGEGVKRASVEKKRPCKVQSTLLSFPRSHILPLLPPLSTPAT